ncbi:MAG TPA: hypothetical protein VIO11_05815 [Candidatus Methanoperedens sp.]
MKSKSILGLLALMILFGLFGAASAFGGDFFGMNNQTRDTILNAIKAKDYNAWKEAMSSQLTEENFNTLVERHEAMSKRQAQKEAMVKAIKEGDYEAWKKAIENSSVNSSKILDEDHFKVLVQLHQAEQEGNFTKVRELSEQLDLPGGFGKHRMFRPFGREG